MAADDEHAFTLRCSRETWTELESYARGFDVSINSVLNQLIHVGLRSHRPTLTAAVEEAKSRRLATRYGRRRGEQQ